jgi:putative transposase
LRAACLPIAVCCALTGIPRGSYYRSLRARPERAPAPRPAPPNKLTAAEREELVAVLNSPRFVDKAPRQVWAALLDEGIYLASVSTMYRLLRERDQVRERRAQARHETRKKPYLAARAPNEIWSWDITKLPGPATRQFYDLYVMIDIFSRYVVHWEIHLRESGELARQFMENSLLANGGIAPQTIHSDNGTAMTSKPVTDLLATLDIIKSHSRPKVSNDKTRSSYCSPSILSRGFDFEAGWPAVCEGSALRGTRSVRAGWGEQVAVLVVVSDPGDQAVAAPDLHGLGRGPHGVRVFLDGEQALVA